MFSPCPPQPPPRFNWEPSSIIAEARSLIEATTQVWDSIARIPLEHATFENAVLPLLHDENSRMAQSRIISFFDSGSPLKELRDASQQATEILSQDKLTCWGREDVFRVIDSVWKKQQEGRDVGDAESHVVLERLRRNFIQAGMGLPNKDSRDRLRAILEQRQILERQYIRNLDADVGGQWLTLEELEGVPATYLGRWTADGDKRFVNRKLPTISVVMKHAVREETRMKTWIDFENRAREQNGELLKKVVIMRDEQARLMGYGNFAKVREEELTMTTEKALEFLDSMRGVLTELGQRELQSLKSAKATELGTASVDNFFFWDRRYYLGKIQEEKFKVNQELLSEYFPFERCLERMLLVQGLLFGVEFVKYPASFPDLVWHPDVKVYAVWDVGSQDKREFLGYLYFDVFPREFKYGHKGHFTLQPGFTKEDGSRHYPCAVFMGNYSPPSDPQPSLLKYAEVVSCFHEIGHSLHNLLSKTKFARFHGTAVPRDFVEVPSIMLEHVFWNREIIRFISGKYDTEEKLPYKMIDQLIAGRFADEGLGSLTNLMLSTYALKIHTQDTHEAVCNLDLASEFNKMRKEICMMSGPEDIGLGFSAVHSFCRYRFPVGYATSYYAYLFADAISYDIFKTKFRPLLPERSIERIEDMATPELREQFRRYREMVLQPGGSHSSCLGALGLFLGREPNAGAWLQALRESISTF